MQVTIIKMICSRSDILFKHYLIKEFPLFITDKLPITYQLKPTKTLTLPLQKILFP